MSGDIYCRQCGSKLEEHKIKLYDPNTGEQRTARHCPNEKCEDGCGYLGHQWSGFFGLGNRCKRCGYVIYDYY